MKNFAVLLFWILLISGGVGAQEAGAPLATLQGNNTLDQLTEVQEKNKYAQIKYSVAAVKLAQEGAGKFVHGGECQLSCPYGCCDSSAGLILEGGVFMLLNNQATMQSKTHQLVAKEACVTYNKFSSTPKNCAAEVKPFDITKPDTGWYDEKGKCKATAPPECRVLSLVPGSSIFANKRMNCKKLVGGCNQDFYSTYVTNPDGSITIKGAKKTIQISMDSFKSTKALIAAGVPGEMAGSLMGQFGQMQKKIMGDTKSTFVAMLAPSLQPEKPKTISLSQLEELQSTGRDPASAGEITMERPAKSTGLIKSYRGESIHHSSSDIFEVMTHRYKKTEGSLLP